MSDYDFRKIYLIINKKTRMVLFVGLYVSKNKVIPDSLKGDDVIIKYYKCSPEVKKQFPPPGFKELDMSQFYYCECGQLDNPHTCNVE